MADQSSSPLGLPPTVWIALVVGLAGVFAAKHQPFQEVRPVDSNVAAYRHTPSEDQDIEAREWQDPFSAVAIARRGHPSAELSGADAGPRDLTPHTIERLAAKIPAAGNRVLILGAMLPGAPYANDIETRRRMRYAILAGLFNSGFVSENSEHIGYLTLPPFNKETAQVQDVAAYEWFKSESTTAGTPPTQALLLWLDQDAFRESPLARFATIINSIVKQRVDPKTVSAAIIGPADSDGLKVMSAELDQPPMGQPPKGGCEILEESKRDLSIYSPLATALDWWIISDTVKQRYDDRRDEDQGDHFKDRCARIALYRTIPSDFTVARGLYAELQYRGIRNVSEIALITERDTLYARLISRYFNGCEGGEDIKNEFTVIGGKERGDGGRFKPLCFTYDKGIDGLAPPAPDASGSPQSESPAKSAAPAQAQAPTTQETATGPGQLDYLRRLADELAARRNDPTCRWLARTLTMGDQSEIQQRCGHNIKAIGIVGSDIYDKLLVLQALRRAFPRDIFFTTDLDARLTDAENLPWTHSLVVGSGLGLSLRGELQGSIPPFRDSYQTATYYSTLQAVNGFLNEPNPSPIDLAWTLRAHIFEVGHAQAFDVSADRHPEFQCNPKGRCASIAAWRQLPPWSTGSAKTILLAGVLALVIAACVAALAMGASWMLQLFGKAKDASPAAEDDTAHFNRRIINIIVTTMGIAVLSMWAWGSLVTTLKNDDSRIPPPIFSGASHWGGSMFEALSVLMVVTLVIRGQRKLRSNAQKMLVAFDFPNAQAAIDALAIAYRKSLTPENRRKERWWFPIRRLSGNKQDPGPEIPTAPKHAAEPEAPELPGSSELEVLVGQYLYRGRWTARFRRVAIATILASALLLILEYILMLFEFNLGVSLVNGFSLVDVHYVERGVEDAISLFNLLAIQFLIFWVADAMLLTRSFALALMQDRPKWPKSVRQRQSTELGMAEPWVSMWLDLRLIAWRTGQVASLIWYPSLMIAAMAVAALNVEFGQIGFASNPIALLISAGFVIGAAVLLRGVAENWRGDVLFRVQNARLRELGAPDQDAGKVAQLSRLSKRVESLSDGAFAPYSQQPMVRAVLVPALTYGATAGMQYLHLST